MRFSVNLYDSRLSLISQQIGVGPETLWTVHAAELIAIDKAVEIIGQQNVDGTHEG
jgi:hypothetical protein